MEKRVDYILEDGGSSGTQQQTTDAYYVDTMAEAYAAEVASGQLMQVHAHSIGLLFEQSVTQQNNNFLIANANSNFHATNLLSNNTNTMQQLLDNTTSSE